MPFSRICGARCAAVTRKASACAPRPISTWRSIFWNANKPVRATMHRSQVAEGAQNLLIAVAVIVIALSAGSLFWFA